MTQGKSGNININRSLEEVNSNFFDFEGFKTSVEEVTSYVVEIVREQNKKWSPTM